MQNRSKKLATVASALGLAVAGVALPATPAHAAWAPNCVEVFGPPAIQSALVQNDCATTQKVRVIVSWGPDSSCVTLQAGYEFRYSWSIGSFDGVASC